MTCKDRLIVMGTVCVLLSTGVVRAAQPTLLLSTGTIFPGESLRVEADGIAPSEKARLAFGKGFYPFFPIGPDAQRALMGIRLDASPGKYLLRMQKYVKRIGRWETVSETWVDISSRTFPVEHVNFASDKKELLRWEHQESVRIRKLLLSSSPDQYWEGTFDLPVEGPIIGEFGVRRVRNGNIDAGYHKGYDVKAASGTPLQASSTGVVLMAAALKAHGRTVLLNHGQGVMTIYLHMQSIAVTPGQKVFKGQKIGTVGSSGLSTAPHVHWGLYIHGVAVDGKVWTETEF